MKSLSDYSKHFMTLGNAEYEIARKTLERGFEKLRTRHDLAILRRHLRGPRVLDFPIGTARLFPHLLADFEIHGKDISPVYVNMAKRGYPDIAARFSIASFEEPGEGGPYDSVYSLRVLNNVQDFDLAVQTIATLLVKDGFWLFNLPPARATSRETRDSLTRNGFLIERTIAYDWLSAFRSMSYPERKLREYWVALAARGLAPYWLHRLIDMIMPRKGSIMLVARKTDKMHG